MLDVKVGIQIVVVLGALGHGMALSVMYAQEDLPVWSQGEYQPPIHLMEK